MQAPNRPGQGVLSDVSLAKPSVPRCHVPITDPESMLDAGLGQGTGICTGQEPGRARVRSVLQQGQACPRARPGQQEAPSLGNEERGCRELVSPLQAPLPRANSEAWDRPGGEEEAGASLVPSTPCRAACPADQQPMAPLGGSPQALDRVISAANGAE